MTNQTDDATGTTTTPSEPVLSVGTADNSTWQQDSWYADMDQKDIYDAAGRIRSPVRGIANGKPVCE